MKRKDFYLTEPQIKLLEKEAKAMGISVAELIRRIIDRYFQEKKKNA